jgi:hypothetical protein
MQRDTFKLDSAAIYDPLHPNQRLVICNFNIPLTKLRNLETFETVRQHLETNFPLEAEAIAVPGYFQLSAVYLLINIETNETRTFAGSFNPRGRDLAQITPFQLFEPTTFSEYALVHSDPDDIANKLASFVQGQESVWRFERLISVVVTFQTSLHLNHPIFERHPHFRQHGRGGAAQKSWKVFTTVFD